MKNSYPVFICILLTFLQIEFIQCGQNFTLHLLSQQRGAACLDGTPVGVYVHQGKGQNKDNFVVFFEGGGFCGAGNLADTLQDCYKRSFGRFGTTNVAQPTTNLDRKGIIATEQALNPVFYDWTKIYLIYCDGAQYFGNRSEPIPYKDKKLHFRGTNNVLQQIKYMEDEYDIFRKNKIVVTGVSAGGIATFMYSNLFIEKAVKAKVYSIPDSGIFLTDYISPLTNKCAIRQASKALIDIVWGQQQYPLQKCLKQFNNDVVQCFNAVNLAKYLKSPMLLIESAYDHWSMENILGVTCYSNARSPFSIQNCDQKSLSVINDYRDRSRKIINQIIQIMPSAGAWSPACIQHGFTSDYSFSNPNYRVPGITGKTMPQAILQFLQNPTNPPVYIDKVNWPNNKGCNGLNNTFSLRQHTMQ